MGCLEWAETIREFNSGDLKTSGNHKAARKPLEKGFRHNSASNVAPFSRSTPGSDFLLALVCIGLAHGDDVTVWLLVATWPPYLRRRGGSQQVHNTDKNPSFQ